MASTPNVYSQKMNLNALLPFLHWIENWTMREKDKTRITVTELNS
jgi:hypothetical protein